MDMKQKLIYDMPRIEAVTPLPAAMLCTSNVDPDGVNATFSGFNSETNW